MLVECETLIVGGGMAGAAAAYSLCVKEGLKNVVLLEQMDGAAPKQGSSYGDSRMYRRMYSDPFYAKMQEQALECWGELENRTGQKVLHENGLLFYGQDTEDTVEGSVKGAAQTMRDLNIPHEELTVDQIEARWPTLKAKTRHSAQTPVSGVFEATAGHINSGDACRLMISAAQKEGMSVRYGEELVSLTPLQGSEVECVCKSGTIYLAKRAVVLAMGPWTGDFLKARLGLELDLTIWRIHYAHYDNSGGAKLPQAFNFRPAVGSDGGLYYCFPTGSEKHDMPHGLKVGTDFISEDKARDIVNTMQEFDATPSEDILALMDEWVKENLAGIGKRVGSYCAPYTMTSDAHYFIIDRLPSECLKGNSQSNVVIFAGGNGRAFKFAPLIGDCMASLVLGKQAPMDISKFAIAKNVKNVAPARLTVSPHIFQKIMAGQQVTEDEIKQDAFGVLGVKAPTASPMRTDVADSVRAPTAVGGENGTAAAEGAAESAVEKSEKKKKKSKKAKISKKTKKGCC